MKTIGIIIGLIIVTIFQPEIGIPATLAVLLEALAKKLK